MKNNTFKINVGDLLQSAGKIDQFSFKNKKVSDIPGLSKDGINGDVIIQSFDKSALLVTLENITAKIDESCDTCKTKYTRDLIVNEYYAKFQKTTDANESTDDEIFKIDGNENINIKDMITQAIILQEPFAKKCSKCKKKASEESDDLDYLEGNGNITFS